MILLPLEDKSRQLSISEQEDVSEKVEKSLARSSKFRVLTSEQRSALLNELKIDQQGITSSSESKLLESSDGLLHIEINTTSVEGKISLKLNLRLILRNGRKFPGSAILDKSNLDESVSNATDDLIRTAYPDETETHRQTTSNGKQSPVLRSAILPGWGQFTRGDKIRGVVYGSIFFLGVGMAVVNYE